MASAQIEWLGIGHTAPDSATRIDIGQPLNPSRTPDAQLLVTFEDASHFFVTLRSVAEECFPFPDARVWHGLLVVGWGCAFYVVDLHARNYSRHPVNTYFGSIATGADFGRGDDFLLVACGERVTRVNEDGSLMWMSDVVGIDGVIINDAVDGIINGSGEWDPPGGWEPFSLRLSDGASP